MGGLGGDINDDSFESGLGEALKGLGEEKEDVWTGTERISGMDLEGLDACYSPCLSNGSSGLWGEKESKNGLYNLLVRTLMRTGRQREEKIGRKM